MSKCKHCGVLEGELHFGICPTLVSPTPSPMPSPLAPNMPTVPVAMATNDGSNAGTSHYDLPANATELKHLIWYKNMNAQVGEMFRAIWRLGSASHSSKERDLRKIIAYAEQELERMKIYGE